MMRKWSSISRVVNGIGKATKQDLGRDCVRDKEGSARYGLHRRAFDKLGRPSATWKRGYATIHTANALLIKVSGFSSP